LLQAGLVTDAQSDIAYILPVSFVQDLQIWQPDLSQAHLEELSEHVLQAYPAARLDSGYSRWCITERSSHDYFDLSSQHLTVDYAKHLVNIELSLYASELNSQREKQGLIGIGSVRVVKPIQVKKTAKVYANRPDTKVIFDGMDFTDWLNSPDLNAYLIFSSEDHNTQMQEIKDVILHELERRSLFQVAVYDKGCTTMYSSRLIRHYVSKAGLLVRGLLKASDIVDGS
jgi:hypothetical protein